MINSVYEMMVNLVRHAKCPACDGSGQIATQRGKYDYDVEQCQWCYERDLVMSHFEIVEAKEKEKECKTNNPDEIPF
jgi:hypothetical protein